MQDSYPSAAAAAAQRAIDHGVRVGALGGEIRGAMPMPQLQHGQSVSPTRMAIDTLTSRLERLNLALQTLLCKIAPIVGHAPPPSANQGGPHPSAPYPGGSALLVEICKLADDVSEKAELVESITARIEL